MRSEEGLRAAQAAKQRARTGQVTRFRRHRSLTNIASDLRSGIRPERRMGHKMTRSSLREAAENLVAVNATGSTGRLDARTQVIGKHD